MTGEVAIITGAGSGIGLASALKLFGRGASILGVGRSPDKLTRLEAAIGDPSRVASLALDVMQDDAPKGSSTLRCGAGTGSTSSSTMPGSVVRSRSTKRMIKRSTISSA